MKEIGRAIFLNIVMFDGASNVKIEGILLKLHYQKLTVMNGVEHTVLLFFNYVSKIPIVHQMISVHRVINNIFGYGIYIISLIPFLNHNIKSFTIKTLVFLAEIIP